MEESQNESNHQLSDNEVNGIYASLSIQQNEDIDTKEDLNFIQECIEELWDEKFRLIDKDSLLGNALLLNNKFVELIKFCNKKAKFKKVGYIFVGFCDYFDLECDKVYPQFHEKIQYLIKISTRNICGANIYDTLKQKTNKHPNIIIPSIFNLK